jgi:hypothetical protein
MRLKHPFVGCSSRSNRDVVAGLHHADSHRATHGPTLTSAFNGFRLTRHAWPDNVNKFLWIVVADGTENQHEAAIKLMRKYRGDLEEFGACRNIAGASRGRLLLALEIN